VPDGKYIFVTGGVASALGKGVSIASIGALLEARGFRVTIQKMDPYLNVDPGTMSPYQHGEVYVTDDGAETDLDLGYYERFTNSNLTKANSVSTGQVYYSVIQRERRGEYLGRTVQVIPHVTNEIKNRISLLRRLDQDLDFVLVEIGGTVGDIESVPYLEAIRQFRLDKGPESTMFIHLTLVPTITAGGEIKTKPTQHSVKELLKQGIQPDILICRTEKRLNDDVKKKISLFCNVPQYRVVTAPDINHTIYEIPGLFHSEQLDNEIVRYFHLESKSPLFVDFPNPGLEKWEKIVNIIREPVKSVKIALVGKYMSLTDAYRSLYEALSHGGLANKARVEFVELDSEDFTKEEFKQALNSVDGVLVPGGFGQRGIEGKLWVIQQARENQIPFFGICLGMQCAVIEYARNVLQWEGAHSTEFDDGTAYPVISLMEEQVGISDKGGTMRLGSYPCTLAKNSQVAKAYQKDAINERHRHRFEFTNRFRGDLEKAGLVISGSSPDNSLVEVVELAVEKHPWFLATQFHPEFLSKPFQPHPLFVQFIKAALDKQMA
jgi:CTP synthase